MMELVDSNEINPESLADKEKLKWLSVLHLFNNIFFLFYLTHLIVSNVFYVFWLV